jgi:penicillin-binding protein 2
MVGVTREGTSAAVFSKAEYVSAGKTGTAQVVAIKKNEKYDAKKVAERQRDHSLYTAFAPADNPRIAIAIVVENGGFGAEAAAPIVKKALDYYLLGKRPEDKDKPANTKEGPADARPEAGIKADADSIGGPKPGAVTQGNAD